MADAPRVLLPYGAASEDCGDGPRIGVRQTHISRVFLTGEHAFKVKKDVRFGFLDFTTIENRRRACEREVELNRRLCPGLYIGVIPVTADETGRLWAGGGGRTVDWAVWMRRLPEERMLSALLRGAPAAGLGECASAGAMRKIAEALRPLYARDARAALDPRLTEFGSLDTFRSVLEGNLREAEALPESALAPAVRDLCSASLRRMLDGLSEPILDRVDPKRAPAGNLRLADGHGDLRSENICLTDPPAIFDCVEFSDAFRCGDILKDAAFLAMDLDAAGRGDLSEAFLARYEELYDPGYPRELLRFYKAFRALVSGKVDAWVAGDAGVGDADRRARLARSRDYFDACLRRLIEDRRLCIIMCGPAGVGKSSVASRLASALRIEPLATDRMRPSAAPRDDRYSPRARKSVYETLFREAAKRLAAGRSAILDATFRSRAMRQRAYALAAEAKADAFLVRVSASEEAVRRNYARRASEGDAHGSEATYRVYLQQAASFEEVSDDEPCARIAVDASGDPDAAAREALAGIAGAMGERLR